MAYFRGGLDGQGGHDHLAKEIAQAGKEWATRYYRWEDLEAYNYRFMLEYARLWSDDRGDMDLEEGAEFEEPGPWSPLTDEDFLEDDESDADVDGL